MARIEYYPSHIDVIKSIRKDMRANRNKHLKFMHEALRKETAARLGQEADNEERIKKINLGIEEAFFEMGQMQYERVSNKDGARVINEKIASFLTSSIKLEEVNTPYSVPKNAARVKSIFDRSLRSLRYTIGTYGPEVITIGDFRKALDRSLYIRNFGEESRSFLVSVFSESKQP